jgi:hypothetical protein
VGTLIDQLREHRSARHAIEGGARRENVDVREAVTSQGADAMAAVRDGDALGSR